MSAKENLIVILGPTATGKTELAVNLAKKLRSRVISGDSMLVYKGFDIGTAKPTIDEMQGVRHELIDILEPEESFSVADFVRLAKDKISEANRNGEIPILAGGTGLYVKSLLEGYEFNQTTGDPVYRKQIEQLATEKGTEYVFSLLQDEDPVAAARVDAKNLRRIIRALEVHHLGGETISASSKLAEDGLAYHTLVIGLRRERKALYERINKRVDMMIGNGLADEVRNLLKQGVSIDAPAMKGIGYKEIVESLATGNDISVAADAIKAGTRHFAKRQFTWYRKMPYIRWYDVDLMSAGSLLDNVYETVEGYFAFR